MGGTTKGVLDPCCGSRMFFFDKQNPNTVYGDIRQESHVLCDGRTLNITPDVIMDFRDLPFSDETFHLVIFDPPHLKQAGETSWIGKKYGVLNEDWQEDLSKGFSECWRVNRKVILPYVVDWSFGYPRCSWGTMQKLDDIDRGLRFLSGKSFDIIKRTSASIESCGNARETSGSSEFFDFRLYKKGTGHFTFRDVDLWESFNISACKGKNWLPGTNSGTKST